eukprot:TRINITY_DN14182_c1_g3_i1.p1 TRINITY_DN14182_c1_g3~~TRINITY_DN14182_c1_g3_i1.p1  ORF type:complete len:873 (+),score=183.70 TRINITY_DN14182_c1_g3_i1:70-2688(+)
MDTSDGDASWVVLGAGQLQGSKAPAASMPAGAFDFTELQQRVIAFNAGDEKYSGEWLTNFQRTPAAWDACVEALRTGAPTSLDEEFLQEFCAQTLARLGRTFGARHAEASRRSLREELELLLTIHAQGRAPVWRQLALALTCADLWIGDWSPERVVGPLGSSLPAALRRELLSLPAELLFCDRALPLDNPKLRHAAASALLEACSEVFPVLVDIEDGGEEGARLRVVAAWLRVLRKCLRVLPTFDAAGPLRALAAQGVELMILAEASPENAVEVAQQLARWRCSHAEVAELLRPLLECIFRSPLEESGRQALLPLLADLASDCWPRAAFGDLDLAWEDIAEQALLVLAEARAAPDYGEECDDGHDVDAEAALELWGTFAETVREGVRELPGPPTLDEVAQASGEGEQAAKRSRVGETWRPSTERIAHAEALQRLFAGLSHKLLELMVAPSDFLVTGGEALIGLWDLRRVAEGVLRAWATLVGRSAVLEEATWAPLHRVGQTLTAAAASGDPACIDDGVWRDAEVVLWFSAALAAGWPDNASGAVPPVALAVPELGVIDAAPPPWRALLWASAAGLAATAPADRCPQMIEWMLLRPPASAGVPELMAVTELPYAHALERACRRLPGDVAHAAAGEQIATLAFVDRPPAALHEETPKAQRTLLLAMRHALGSDLAILCQGLSGSILPGLRTAVESEREAFVGEESEAPFLAAQALFATLATAVPPVDSSSSAVGADTSAAIALWKSHWGYVEDAMLNRACNKATEQPLAAAADALTTAALALPELLAPAAELLAKSAARRFKPSCRQCVASQGTRLGSRTRWLQRCSRLAIACLCARRTSLRHPRRLPRSSRSMRRQCVHLHQVPAASRPATTS